MYNVQFEWFDKDDNVEAKTYPNVKLDDLVPLIKWKSKYVVEQGGVVNQVYVIPV